MRDPSLSLCAAMSVAKAWGSPSGASRQTEALTDGVDGRTFLCTLSKISCVAQKTTQELESFKI
jgi:hypothetical protein